MYSKIALTLTLIIYSMATLAADLQSTLTKKVEDVMPDVVFDASAISYVSLAKEVQFWIFAFVGIIAVAYIITVGAKLLWAPGGEEDTSNAIKSLVYVGVGLAIMPLAYFIVDFIISIRL